MTGLAEELFIIAQEQGKKFKTENGREPTESEAEQISEMIMRQLRTAQVMLK